MITQCSKNEILTTIEKPHQLFSQDKTKVSMYPVYGEQWNRVWGTLELYYISHRGFAADPKTV